MATKTQTRGLHSRIESSCDPEIEQRLKSLQRPAACSLIFSIVERYIRSVSSRDPIKSSLPSRESLLELIDTYILLIPAVSSSSSSDPYRPFTVFEELELLETLRVQVEERLNRDIQLVLFDVLFGITNDSKTSSDHRLSILHKLVSLAISGLGNGVILQCTTFWMEIYPEQSSDLAQYIYFEFCELLPNAMEPLMQIGSSYPLFAKLLTHHLSHRYPIHSVTTQPFLTHNHCPPIKLLHLISHWLNTNPDYLTSLPLNIEPTAILIRSQAIRTSNINPLFGLAQWCVLEPFITDDTVLCLAKQSNLSKGERLVQYRTEMSRLHASLLSYMVPLGNAAPVRLVLTTDDVSLIISNLLDLYQKVTSGDEEKEQRVELSLDRLAQILQIGLTVGIVTIKPSDLTSVLSNLPPNRLLSIVCAHYIAT